MKSARHQAILDLIEKHPIDRQEDLLAHLREEGFDVTQATVSRDIRDLQLVKVAAFADNQLLIQKNVRDDRTFTEIHTLDMNGRVEVLARMISGDKVTELSLANARELIEKSK